MKPNWNDAPDWANWLAMDQDGAWYWYQNEPFKGNGYFTDDGKHEMVTMVPSWQESLEQRPR